VAEAINAKDDEISLALATVFVLNAIALFIFPVIGHLLDMSQHAFGTWAARRFQYLSLSSFTA